MRRFSQYGDRHINHLDGRSSSGLDSVGRHEPFSADMSDSRIRCHWRGLARDRRASRANELDAGRSVPSQRIPLGYPIRNDPDTYGMASKGRDMMIGGLIDGFWVSSFNTMERDGEMEQIGTQIRKISRQCNTRLCTEYMGVCGLSGFYRALIPIALVSNC